MGFCATCYVASNLLLQHWSPGKSEFGFRVRYFSRKFCIEAIMYHNKHRTLLLQLYHYRQPRITDTSLEAAQGQDQGHVPQTASSSFHRYPSVLS